MTTLGAPVGLAYDPEPGFDELIGADGRPRPVADALWRHLSMLGPGALVACQRAADEEMRALGVTFRTYGEGSSVDRQWPFDVIPRVLDAAEWHTIHDGVVQRLRALNCFIDDVYHSQRAIREGVVPADAVIRSPNFRPECVGVDPPARLWAHICGSDLVRDEDGTFYVLEDNLRVPSGVSYVLENRAVTKRVFPELFRSYSIEPVDPYLVRLGALLTSLAPSEVGAPRVAVLTPGVFNSAYFEHAFLAQQLGAELVEGTDLVVLDDDTVCMHTIDGLERVDVLYRRVDDLFLDPEVFRRDSRLGVPGLMRAWRRGRVALVNAPGTGVADDKAVYPFVPDMIRFYLDEEPLLANVPTLRCADEAQRAEVLGHLSTLVIKPANEAGGTGITIGPVASAAELEEARRRVEEHPSEWVAQPLVRLSSMPALEERAVVSRHVDLRPFALLGPELSYVTPGGLTRVARGAGSLIVNSSQGGGSKDTWVVTATRGPTPAAPEPVPGPGAPADRPQVAAPFDPSVGPAGATGATGTARRTEQAQ